MSAWSFTTIPHERRQYAGNHGYADDLMRHYDYDSDVPNHKNVAVGDQVLLRDHDFILGTGRVEVITVEEGRKVRLRCPECDNTSLKVRKHGLKYRCDRVKCRKEFDEPKREEVSVRLYRAVYEQSWRPLELPVRVSELKTVFADGATQFAIRRLKTDEFTSLLASWGVPSEVGGNSSNPLGGHVLSVVKKRNGQDSFRKRLLERFGSVCAITGSQPPQVLEAAHLYTYAKNPKHDLSGGLLLRRDLHALFDAGLLCVDPESWRVKIAPVLAGFPALAVLNDMPLAISDKLRPKPEYLAAHIAEAHASGNWQ